VTPDEFGPLGMNRDEMDRAHAAIRRVTKECIDVTRERLGRGERPNLSAVAQSTVTGMRSARWSGSGSLRNSAKRFSASPPRRF
jgi:hypothetical protein